MLAAFCQLLRGLTTADDGVESVLNEEAYKGLLAVTESVYGAAALEVVKNAFTYRNGWEFVGVVEMADQDFLEVISGGLQHADEIKS